MDEEHMRATVITEDIDPEHITWLKEAEEEQNMTFYVFHLGKLLSVYPNVKVSVGKSYDRGEHINIYEARDINLSHQSELSQWIDETLAREYGFKLDRPPILGWEYIEKVVERPPVLG